MNYIKGNFGKVLLFLSIIITFFLFNISTSAVTEMESIKAPYVEAKVIKASNNKTLIKSQGFISSGLNLNIVCEIQSKVKWLSTKLEVGSSFMENDTLLILDKKDFELALILAESQLLNSKIKLDKEKAEYDIANDEWNKVGKGKGSELALRKPQLASAELGVSLAQGNLDKAKRDLQKTIFIAPFDGRVINEFVEVNSTVFPGNIIANIYSVQSFEVKLPIADRDLDFIDVIFDGSEIELYNRPQVRIKLSDKYLPGVIIRAEVDVNPKTKMRSLIATINNNNNFGELLSIGQFVEAEIYGKTLFNTFKVPRNKIRNNQVWVIDKENFLRRRVVEILRYENEYVFISKGFLPLDNLLSSRISNPIDGLLVTMELN